MFAAFRWDHVRNRMIFLPAERVDSPSDTTPIAAGATYCQLWLREMRLSHNFGWFHRYYPVVHASTSFTYGRQVVKNPCLAGPFQLADLTPNNLHRVISCHHELTPLFPYKGGDVEIKVGLFSMIANDPVKGFVTAVERIAKLIPIPQFSTMLDLIPPVYESIEDLMGVGKAQLQIGYDGRFVSAGSGVVNQLKGGYFAVILDEQNSLDLDELCIVGGHLMIGAKGMQGEFKTNPRRELEQYSYMLFELETRPKRDVWILPALDKLKNETRLAEAQGDFKKAREVFNQLISAIVQSDDLLESEQNTLAFRIREWLNRMPLQAVQSRSPHSLAAIMSQEFEPHPDAETESLLAEWRQFYERQR